jgi:hypothetical protein
MDVFSLRSPRGTGVDGRVGDAQPTVTNFDNILGQLKGERHGPAVLSKMLVGTGDDFFHDLAGGGVDLLDTVVGPHPCDRVLESCSGSRRAAASSHPAQPSRVRRSTTSPSRQWRCGVHRGCDGRRSHRRTPADPRLGGHLAKLELGVLKTEQRWAERVAILRITHMSRKGSRSSSTQHERYPGKGGSNRHIESCMDDSPARQWWLADGVGDACRPRRVAMALSLRAESRQMRKMMESAQNQSPGDGNRRFRG